MIAPSSPTPPPTVGSERVAAQSPEVRITSGDGGPKVEMRVYESGSTSVLFNGLVVAHVYDRCPNAQLALVAICDVLLGELTRPFPL
jgi:hypothetical protein